VSGPLDFDPPGAEREPPPPVRPTGPPPSARPPGTSSYVWLVGVLVVVILGYILVNTLRTEHKGAGGPTPGSRMPGFAAPLVLSSLEGAPNNCSVHLRDAVNICDLYRDRPAVLGFLFTRGAKCSGSFDAMQRLSATMRGVGFVGVIVAGGRDNARKLVREHGWSFPIGFDDGRVANAYGVIAVCPETVLAYPGGKVRETLVGRDRAERALPEHVARLVEASKRRGWSPS